MKTTTNSLWVKNPHSALPMIRCRTREATKVPMLVWTWQLENSRPRRKHHTLHLIELASPHFPFVYSRFTGSTSLRTTPTASQRELDVLASFPWNDVWLLQHYMKRLVMPVTPCPSFERGPLAPKITHTGDLFSM